ncbi:MAG: anti-sigma factor [Thermoanaerobaculia bacterium]
MRKEKLEELIHLDFDGRATPEERLATAEALEHDPQARAIHAEMREVHQILDRRPKVDPPEDLRRRIATGVHRLSPRPTEAPVRGLASAPQRRQRVMRITLAAAATLTLAVLLAPALFHDTDPDQLRGTMTPPAATENQTKLIPLAGNGIEGVVVTAWEGPELVLRPELRSPGPARLEVGFNPGKVKLLSTAGSVDASNAQSGLVTVTLDGAPPEIRFLRQSGEPVTLFLALSNGETKVSTEVRFQASTNFSPGGL